MKNKIEQEIWKKLYNYTILKNLVNCIKENNFTWNIYKVNVYEKDFLIYSNIINAGFDKTKINIQELLNLLKDLEFTKKILTDYESKKYNSYIIN